MQTNQNRRLLGATDLIIGAWENFRAHFASYRVFVLALAVLALIQWIVTILIRNAVPADIARVALTSLAVLPVQLLVMAISIAITHLTWNTLTDAQPDLRASFTVGGRKLLSFIWVSILIGLALLVGAIALVLPFVYLFVALAFATYYLIIEDVRGTKALGASMALVRGRWWAVLWRLVIPMLFFHLATMLAAALLDLVIGSFMGDPRLFFSDITVGQTLTNAQLLVTIVVSQTTAAVALPLHVGAGLLLWSDLRRG